MIQETIDSFVIIVYVSTFNIILSQKKLRLTKQKRNSVCRHALLGSSILTLFQNCLRITSFICFNSRICRYQWQVFVRWILRRYFFYLENFFSFYLNKTFEFFVIIAINRLNIKFFTFKLLFFFLVNFLIAFYLINRHCLITIKLLRIPNHLRKLHT